MIPLRCPLRGVVYDVFLTESGIILLHESTHHRVQSISSHCGDGVYGHSVTPEAQNLRGGGGWVQSLEFWPIVPYRPLSSSIVLYRPHNLEFTPITCCESRCEFRFQIHRYG